MPSPRKPGRRGGVDIYLTWIEQDRRARKRRRKPGGGGSEAVPVEPNRPNTLSGGAAAALEFDA